MGGRGVQMGLSGGLRDRSPGWAGDHEQVALAQTEPQRSQRQHSQRAVENQEGSGQWTAVRAGTGDRQPL